MKRIDPSELSGAEPIVALWRTPFSSGPPTQRRFLPGSTIADMIAEMPMLPADFAERGHVIVVGTTEEHAIATEHWGRVRLKGGCNIRFAYALGLGGDDGGAKGVLGLVLAVATVLTAGLAAGGFFATSGGLFAAGSLSAKLLATGISVVGSLAASALSAPPATPQDAAPSTGLRRGPASIQGNVLEAGAAIPRVVGTRRIFPPLACQPLTERVGQDEIAEAVAVLAGPHALADIRVGDALIDEAQDVTYQTREGWGGDTPITNVARYGITLTPNLELTKQQVDSEDRQTIADQGNPSGDMPVWHTFTAANDADQLWLQLTLPAGLKDTDDPTARMTVPFQVRMRASEGDPWIYLPELHYSTRVAAEQRPTIRLHWQAAPAIPAVPVNEGWVTAYIAHPGQSTLSPSTDAFAAHSYFDDGAGDDWLANGNEGSTAVRNIALGQHDAILYLDEATFPKGRYTVEIKRGTVFNQSGFTRSSYQSGGSVRDFFWYFLDSGTAKNHIDTENIADTIYLVRFCSVFDVHPIMGGNGGTGLAIVAVKAINREIPNLSVRASGYVRDWDAGEETWSDWKTTSNPAPHFRDVLRGSLTPEPLEEALIDDASLLAWRQDCIDNGYTCDLICEGAGIAEALTKIAGCGYARPAASEVWGVVRDYDRSAEDPVQIFTSRNSSGLSMAKAFARVPDAFRISYRKADDLDVEHEVFVYREGAEGKVNPRIEAVQYDGLVSEAAVTQRGRFDLRQAVQRSDFWSFKAPVEAIQCRRGDLIGVNHDVIDKTHASARVIDVHVEGGEVTGVELDSIVPVWNEPNWEDIVAVEDVEAVEDIGLKSVISIRQADGESSEHQVDGVTGSRSTVMFSTPVAVENDPDDGDPAIRTDCLARIGQGGNIAMRLVVAGVTYDKDHHASITAVAEAPGLWAA